MPSLLVPSVLGSVRTAPSAPAAPTVTDVGTSRAYDDGSATVTYSAPTYDGKLPITSYTITGSPGGSGTDSASPFTATGLDTSPSGTSHSFTVAATNAIGTGSASSAGSATITSVPATMSAPTASVSNSTTVSLSFTAPNTGGKSISSYTVESNPSISLSYSGTSSPMSVTGSFGSGTSYTFRMRANNANGSGVYSSYSGSVTPNPSVTVPGTPTIGSPSVISSTQVDVAFTPPASNGGATITGYAVQSSPSISLSYSSSDTTSPIRVTGSFALNTYYQFRVAAINSVGTGSYSSYSFQVAPNSTYDCANPTTQAECEFCGGIWNGSACIGI